MNDNKYDLTEGREKLKEIVDKIDVGMICTFPENSDYPHGVPMSRQEVDDQGNIWYICSADSDTHRNIEKNDKVSLFYADAKNYTFLSINGTATLLRDQARIDKYWNKFMESWFEKGKDDPNIRLLRVDPIDAHYWDSDSSKIGTFFTMVKNMVTGDHSDLGKEGDLNV